MTTYEGLYHDVLSTIGLLHESAKYPPLQFMRDLSKALNDFQMRTRVVEAEKKLFRQSGFELGSDVLGIREIADEDDNRLLMVSYEQNRGIFETYVEGRTDADDADSPRARLGKPSYGTTPANFDLQRNPPDTGISPWDKSTRLCCEHNNRIIVFPDLGDKWLQLYYYPNLELFHQSSKQWRAFFPADTANFDTAFTEAGVGDKIQPYEQALCDWVTQEWYVREGSDKFKVYYARYETTVRRAAEKPRAQSREMVTDYRMGAYSS